MHNAIEVTWQQLEWQQHEIVLSNLNQDRKVIYEMGNNYSIVSYKRSQVMEEV